MHGKTDMIHHDDRGLYEGLPNPFVATRYHSLVIEPGTLSDGVRRLCLERCPGRDAGDHGYSPPWAAGLRRAVSSGELSHRLRHDHPGAIPGSNALRMKEEGSRMKKERAKAATATTPSSFILHPSSLVSLDVRPGRRGRRTVVGRMPPLGFWPLAWIAPAWWVLLVRCRELPPLAVGAPKRRRPALLLIAWLLWFAVCVAAVAVGNERKYEGFWVTELLIWPAAIGLLLAAARWWRNRPYRTLWLVGLVFWLSAIAWLRLPHWATCFGWLALSFYFAFYLPFFVGLSRVAVHRLRVPVIVAAPVVWTGLELARSHLLTGMTMASLGHTQYRWVQLIQLSDLGGTFAVSFLVMFVAACLGRMAPCDGRHRAPWPLAPAAGRAGRRAGLRAVPHRR